MAKKETVIEVEGKTLSLSNLDKVLYPAVGFTKGQVIDYYTRIAPAVLPHLRDRPLTLERHPSLSLADEIDRPTAMAFDLDPGEPAGLAECCEVALLLRDALARLGL